MSNKAIFGADFHGNRYAFERLFAEAVQRKIKVVILGGDLTPKTPIITTSNGGLLPLHPRYFREDKNGYTYVDYLREIKDVIGSSRTKAEKHFIALGEYLVHSGKPGFIEDMLEEQEVLRKIIDTVPTLMNSNLGLTLCDIEWDVLELMLKNSLNLSEDLNEMLATWRCLTLGIEQYTKANEIIKIISDQKQKLLMDNPEEIRQLLRLIMPTVKHNKPESTLLKLKVYCKAIAREHFISTWSQKTSGYETSVKPQKDFLEYYLARRIKKFKDELPGAEVYVILGNDDNSECEPIVKRLHERGVVRYISGEVAQLSPDLLIAGYQYIGPMENVYCSDWQKIEQEIEIDLTEIEAETAGKKTIFVVHVPPKYTKLDLGEGGRKNFGSTGVRGWLTKGSKHVLLSGHIHEAPFTRGGSWREVVEGTPCFQPGGWHDEGLCAVVFDLDNPEDAEWIHNSYPADSQD